MKIPPLLFRHPSTGFYSLRVVVPVSLRKQIGQTEFKRTLKTRDPFEAIRLATIIRATAMGAGVTKPTVKEILESADKLLHFENRVDPMNGRTFIYSAKPGQDYKNAKEAMENSNQQLEQVAYNPKPVPFDSRIVLMDCYRLWAARLPNIKDKKTRQIKEKAITDFSEFLQEKRSDVMYFDQIGVDLIDNYITYLRSSHKLKDSTIGNKITYLIQFFNLVIKDKSLNIRNPAQGVFVYQSKDRTIDAEESGFRQFTIDELRQIFGAQYTKQFKRAYHFFPPLLALFTGCRISEAAQLDKANVVEIDGVKCIAINRKGIGKRLKNDNSKRVIPLNTRIAETGFFDYVDSLRDDAALFPELNRNNNNGAGMLGMRTKTWTG